MMSNYHEVSAESVPEHLIWVTPRRDQGQIVDGSYARQRPVMMAGGTPNYEADHGDPWKRVIDHADGSTHYYARRRKA